MWLEPGRTARLDRVLAFLFGIAVSLIAYFAASSSIDYRAWQQICEGALIRPPEFFQPGAGRLVVYALTRFLGLGMAIKVLALLGPVALGIIAYQATRTALAVLTALIKVDVVRAEFRTVMLPVLTITGLSLFLLSYPVLHAASILTPSIFVLAWVFLVIGAFRNFFEGSSMSWANWGIFLCGGLAAESLGGWVLLIGAVCLAFWRVQTDSNQSFVLCDPGVFHVSKWTLTLLFLLGGGLVVVANAWFFSTHGGIWSAAFRDYAVLPNLNAVAVLMGLVVAPLLVTFNMMPRSSDSERYLPYAHGVLLIMIGLLEIFVCCRPDIIAIENETVKMLLLAASSLTATAAILTLLVDVYCRVQTRYPKLMRVIVFRLVIGVLLAVLVLRLSVDGSRQIGEALDQVADEIVRESSGLRRIFSDGAMDALLEIKASLTGESLRAHSMFSGHGEYETNLRCRDVSGDDDLSMMRIGAPVALASWVGSESPELKSSAVQLGFEAWKRAEKPVPTAGGFVARLDGWQPDALSRSRQWGDAFVRSVLDGLFDRAYETCREKRLCEAFDMLKWRSGRMLELRANELENIGKHDEARGLRDVAARLDRQNGSLRELRAFMNLVWNQDDLQLTPREALKIALGRANFRAARPHAEAILSTDPADAAANFALGMYYYALRDFARAEGYLLVAHQARPKDAAILNNLALMEMYLGKLDAAEAHAKAAQVLKPNVREIESTLREIRQRKAKVTR